MSSIFKKPDLISNNKSPYKFTCSATSTSRTSWSFCACFLMHFEEVPCFIFLPASHPDNPKYPTGKKKLPPLSYCVCTDLIRFWSFEFEQGMHNTSSGPQKKKHQKGFGSIHLPQH